jgi:lipoprotein-anchoring transpeptidase ErfK/SrfK
MRWVNLLLFGCAVAYSRQTAPDLNIMRAQVLLARAHFSCGEIDGYTGRNFEKTVAAFQGDRGLPVTRTLDEPTLAALNADTNPVTVPYTITEEDEPTLVALNADTNPVTVPYTITEEDLKGPFVRIPKEMSDKAKLPAMGYTSALEMLAERYHASPKLLQTLNPGADFNKAGQEIVVPNALVMPPAGEAAQVVVSKGESSVRVVDGSGKLLAFYVATIGSEHDPLPVGTWKINGVGKNPKFHYNPKLFWDAKKDDDKATIQPGPNNPVGIVWIDLSKEHYGIHGAPDPSRVGHVTSHGCIRLTNWDAFELAGMVKPGMPAILKEMR